MQSQVQERFSAYYERWLLLQEANLHQLLSVSRDSSHEQQHRLLVFKITNLYKDYYTVKWAAAHDDVLGFFAPSWLSPLENAHLWMTGWKPSIFYRLVQSLRHAHDEVPGTSLSNLSDEKVKKIEELKWRTSLEEERVEREMERQQVSMADRRMVELARLANGRGRDDDMEVSGYLDVALNNLLVGLERVMKSADCARLKALKGVLEVLNPLQCVDFMAAVLMVQLRMSRWGKRSS